MSDTIDRQAAIEIVDRYDKAHMILKGKPMLGAASIVIELEALPPAQPEPHGGYWIRRDCGLDVECKCSKCGYRDFVEPGDEYWFKRNYCPNCGAKMTISTK